MIMAGEDIGGGGHVQHRASVCQALAEVNFRHHRQAILISQLAQRSVYTSAANYNNEEQAS
jgi:hypothetical protein